MRRNSTRRLLLRRFDSFDSPSTAAGKAPPDSTAETIASENTIPARGGQAPAPGDVTLFVRRKSVHSVQCGGKVAGCVESQFGIHYLGIGSGGVKA
jgi:hypothetical protein